MPRYWYHFNAMQLRAFDGYVDAETSTDARHYIIDHWRTLHVDDDEAPLESVKMDLDSIELQRERPFNEEQPLIDRMEQYGDDDGDPTRYDEGDPMYRGGPDEDMSWMDDEEDEEETGHHD